MQHPKPKMAALKLRLTKICIILLIWVTCTTLVHIYYSHSVSPNPLRNDGTTLTKNLGNCFNLNAPSNPKAWIDVSEKYVLFSLNYSETIEMTTKSRVELHLNLRKLIHFAVHEVNEQTRGNPECVKWWANLLTTTEIYKTEIRVNVFQWRIRFDMEPGRVPFEMIIRQNNLDSDEINLRVQTELELVSVEPLNWYNPSDNVNISHICICKTDLAAAVTATSAARSEWSTDDPEISTWPLDTSFLVSDYLDYLNMDTFLLSPGKYGDRDTNYCGPSVRMLVTIFSAPYHFKRRQAIRETFGNSTYLNTMQAKLLFFLGTISQDHVEIQTRVTQEAWQYEDIVQADFVDSYHNLTLKHLTMFQWINLKCGANIGTVNTSSVEMPRSIFKGDDDYFLNVDAALEIANANPDSGLIGYLNCGMPTLVHDVQPAHRLYLAPAYMYRPFVYPAYLSGAAYILRAELIPRLLQASLTIPLFHLEDVYVTGMLRNQIKVQPEHVRELFSLFRIEPHACSTKRVVISATNGPEDLVEQWKKFRQPVTYVECLLSDINFNATKASEIKTCLLEVETDENMPLSIINVESKNLLGSV